MRTKITTDERINAVTMLAEHVQFELKDGRCLAVPFVWYPRLNNAPPAERNKWEIGGGGFVVRWPTLEEDLEISGLLAGNAAPELRASVELSGAHIRDFRKESGLSQIELAEQLGVRQATVSDWEKGKATPSPLAAARLSELIRKSALAAETRSSSQSIAAQGSVRILSQVRPIGEQDDIEIEHCAPSTRHGRWERQPRTNVGEFCFTDLHVTYIPDRQQDELATGRFNAVRCFLHSVGFQKQK